MPEASTAAAIRAAINVASVTNLATGGIHRDAAPQGTARPFVNVQFVGGAGTEHTFTQKVSDDHRWQIDVYADDNSHATLSGTELCDQIMAAVETALFDAALSVTGKATLYCRKDRDLPAPGEFDGTVWVSRRSAQWKVEHS